MASLSIGARSCAETAFPQHEPWSSSTAVSTTTTGGLASRMKSAQRELADRCATPKSRTLLFDPGRVMTRSTSSSSASSGACSALGEKQ